MYVVGEVFGDGHPNLDAARLEAVKHLANRVGFSVLEERSGTGALVHRVKLHISMDNPYFVVRLEECTPAASEASFDEAAD
jgi:hypothetical protein